jgi:hypothetical protein
VPWLRAHGIVLVVSLRHTASNFACLRLTRYQHILTFPLHHALPGSSFQESDCKACPENMTSVPASSFCECKPGYTGEACRACAAGTYKVQTGSQACTACPALSRSAAASTAVTDCLCNAGSTGPNGRLRLSFNTTPSLTLCAVLGFSARRAEALYHTVRRIEALP